MPTSGGSLRVATCPHCRGSIQVDTNFVGTPLECPLCGGRFRLRHNTIHPIPPADPKPGDPDEVKGPDNGDPLAFIGEPMEAASRWNPKAIGSRPAYSVAPRGNNGRSHKRRHQGPVIGLVSAFACLLALCLVGAFFSSSSTHGGVLLAELPFFFFLAVVLLFYFLPTIIAFARGHQDSKMILVLNLSCRMDLGRLAYMSCVVALVYAMTSTPSSKAGGSGDAYSMPSPTIAERHGWPVFWLACPAWSWRAT